MSTIATAERVLSALDFARILRIGSGAIPAELGPALDDIDVLAPREVPPDLVTMRSQVQIRFDDSGQPQVVVLGYPEDAKSPDAPASVLSVLSPLGSALLGLRVGDVAVWRVPGGGVRRARVERLLHQPEADGDFQS